MCVSELFINLTKHFCAFIHPNCHFMVTTCWALHTDTKGCLACQRGVGVRRWWTRSSSAIRPVAVEIFVSGAEVNQMLERHLCVLDMLKREGIFFFFFPHLVQELLSPIIAPTSRAVVPVYVMWHAGRSLSAESSDKFRLGALKKM